MSQFVLLKEKTPSEQTFTTINKIARVVLEHYLIRECYFTIKIMTSYIFCQTKSYLEIMQDIERDGTSGRWRSRGHLYLQGTANKSITRQLEISLSYYGLLVFTSSNPQLFSVLFSYTEAAMMLALYNLNYSFIPFQIYFFSHLEGIQGKENNYE